MRIPQPVSTQCFVCGVSNPVGLKLKFYQTAPREVTAECKIPEKYQGYPGIVHGGIVASILDEIAGRAFMGVGENPRFMYTAKMQVRYRRNVPVDQPIRLVGRQIKDRGRMATAEGVVYDQDGNRLAECESLLVDVPSEMLDGVDLRAMGWKVYENGKTHDS